MHVKSPSRRGRRHSRTAHYTNSGPFSGPVSTEPSLPEHEPIILPASLYPPTMSESMPLPKIKTGGEDNIEALLKETVGKKVVPAVFYAATNAKETIYANQDGDLIFGDESSGKVNRDTGESITPCGIKS